MTPQDEELLADLLLRWEELRERGQDTSASELCREYPHLTEELARRIHILKVTSWLDKPISDGESPKYLSSPTGEPRTLIGRYRLDTLIAEGGFAQVWRGYDLELERVVAIKVPKPSRLQSAEAFMAEARRVARLKHPGIVPVHDVVREGENYFIVSEYVEGGSLRDHLVKGLPTQLQAIRWIMEIAESLNYAHLLGVIHRDIKPANILIDHHNRALITDFGIASVANDKKSQSSAIGTIRYMSPERLDGAEIKPADDIFSLGIVFHELLTGKLPFFSIDAEHLRKEITSSSRNSAEIPGEIYRIWHKTVDVDRSFRYQSADELAQDLKQIIFKTNQFRIRLFGTILGIILLVASTIYVNSKPGVVKLARDAFGEIHRLENNMGQVLAVAFSPDGRSVLTGDINFGIHLWDVNSGRLLKRFDGHTNWVRALAFSPNGQFFVSASGGVNNQNGQVSIGNDNTLRLWDVSSGKELLRYRDLKLPFTNVAFSQDGDEILSGGDDGIVRLWKRNSEIEICTLKGHSKPVRSVAFVPGNHRAVSSSHDYTIRLWDLDAGKELRCFEGHNDIVEAVACSSDGKWIASASMDRTILIWDIETGKEIQRLVGIGQQFSTICFSPDNHCLLSGSMDGTVRLWSIAKGQYLCLFLGHQAGVLSVAISPDGRKAVSGSMDGTARVWALPKWETANFQHSLDNVPLKGRILTSSELMAQGKKDFDQNFFDRAAQCYTDVIALDPNNAEAHDRRGACKFNGGEFKESVADFTKAMQIEPINADFCKHRAMAYLSLRDFDSAIEDMELALDIKPLDPKPFQEMLAIIYVSRASERSTNKQFPEAIADMTEAIKLFPQGKNFFHQRGSCYFNCKEYEKGAADFTEAIKREPMKGAHYLHRGYCLQSLGKNEEAAGDFEKAKKLGNAP